MSEEVNRYTDINHRLWILTRHNNLWKAVHSIQMLQSIEITSNVCINNMLELLDRAEDPSKAKNL